MPGRLRCASLRAHSKTGIAGPARIGYCPPRSGQSGPSHRHP